MKGRFATRFDADDEDPRASLVNLVDVMLVFACGLLAAMTIGLEQRALREVKKTKSIEVPVSGAPRAGNGYQPVGQVYRDPKTGKLLLVEE